MTDEQLQDFIIDHSGIPARFRSKCLEDLEPEFKNHAERAQKYVEDFAAIRSTDQPGLYLNSPTDVGVAKSHIMSCILKGIVFHGHVKRQVTYYPFGDLMMSLIAEARGEMAEEDVENVRRLKTSEIIAFDDMDKFSGNANTAYRLHRIINDLWDRQVPLLITSNLALGKFADRLVALGTESVVAHSITSRLTGMCDNWNFDYQGQYDHRVTTGGSTGAVGVKSHR